MSNSHNNEMVPDNQFYPPAKRPRLREAPSGVQLGGLHIQSSGSIPSISYITSSLTHQATTNLGPSEFSSAVYSTNPVLQFPEPEQQWMSRPYPLSRLWTPPHGNPECHHSYGTSTMQNYAGRVRLSSSDHSSIIMQSPLPILPALEQPHLFGQFEYSLPGQIRYDAVPVPIHDLSSTPSDAIDQLMSVSNDHRIGELPVEPEDVDTEMVCFGTILNINAFYESQAVFDIQPTFPVTFESSARFVSPDGFQIDGRIPSEHSEMIQGLIDEPALTLHVSCILGDKSMAKNSSRKFELMPCVLEITVYGPVEIFEGIGDWFQGHGKYLQDPRSCHMDVKYCNPHRLSVHDLQTCPLLSYVVPNPSSLELRDIVECQDPLDILSGHADLAEAPQPSVIRTILKRHQKQALTFMLQREKGWGFNVGQPDIWEKVDTATGRIRSFVNTISEVYQIEEPPQFRGGLIADPMGLGKTLTMVALVATDLDANTRARPNENIDSDKYHTPATLIIVPPPLLGSWEEQLFDHVTSGGLKCRRHHGQSKLTSIKDLEGVNIVLTTYQTVSADWKAEKTAAGSTLFQVCWGRIILDEAHFIRNGKSRMARSVCDLVSVARWAVSGTPIQNRLGDLVSLLKFIRVYPYDSPDRFYADISQVWKSGKEQDAVKRLQRLSACLLLRRAKGTIDLPARRDFLLPIQLSQEERIVYNELREQTIIKIDEALHKDPGTSRTGGYVSVLQQIESLRLFCNLGLRYHSRHKRDLQSSDWSRLAQSTFNAQSEMHSITCLKCSSTLDVSESLLDDSTTRRAILFFGCLRALCNECTNEIEFISKKSTCGHRPSCSVARVYTSNTVLEEVSDLMIHDTQPASSLNSFPSKFKALINDLQTIPTDVKCIIFSTWRLTLDLFEKGLNLASISSIRFDGKVPQKDRQGIIDKFRTDPSIRIMLLTLSCGAVGLTLTAASRAYLMEPHWNPTLEEQALARIHRLGQTREVTTVRLYVKDSFEEQVMELQKSKKELASVLLSPHDGGQTDNRLGALEKLRSLL